MRSIQLLSAGLVLSDASARSLLRRRRRHAGDEEERSSGGIEVEYIEYNDDNDRGDLFETRIIGGTAAVVGKHRYAVSLRDNLGYHYCGGSLIARDVVLTAAHCRVGDMPDSVVLMDEENEIDGAANAIREGGNGCMIHPGYDPSTTDNDFMLVFLEESMYGNVKLAKLNSKPYVPAPGRIVTVMGWGDTNARDDTTAFSETLRVANLNVISNRRCDASEGTIGGWHETYEGQITGNMLCARAVGRDGCRGDSGGPLVVRGTDLQVGVISWGIGCGNYNLPGVYARVSSAYRWIESAVCKRSAHAGEAGFVCGDHVRRSRGNDDNDNIGSQAEDFASGYNNRGLTGITNDAIDLISSLLGDEGGS